MFKFQAIQIPTETQSLIAFILSDKWPFHSGNYENIDKTKLYETYSRVSSNIEYFWIMDEENTKVGFFKLFDLDDIGDGFPMFDLRVHSNFRGKGVGFNALKWLSAYIFNKWSEADYIQGATRDDNFAMRKVFLKCNYAKEAHLRRNWDGVHASILYGLLRDDWESGKVTPVNWNDESHLLDPVL